VLIVALSVAVAAAVGLAMWLLERHDRRAQAASPGATKE
jgi:hypothetical protein